MLYRDNEILIFDEPTAVLTPQEIDELMGIMKNLTAEGKSLVFITHKLEEIKRVADRVTVLRLGKCVGTVDVSGVTVEQMSEMMVGRKVILQVNKQEKQPGAPVLEVENLTVKSEGSKKNKVHDLCLKVCDGEIVCIAGVDGNGQSELMYALSGLIPADSGTIKLRGSERNAQIDTLPQHAWAFPYSRRPGTNTGWCSTIRWAKTWCCCSTSSRAFRRAGS